jgi:hypothetical protein
MYQYSSFMVTSTADEESRPIFRDLYTVGGYDEGYFFSHMGGRIIYTLTHFDMYFVYFLFVLMLETFKTAMCIVIHRLGVIAY